MTRKMRNVRQSVGQTKMDCLPGPKGVLTMANMLMTGPQIGPKLQRAFGIFSGDLRRRYNTLEIASMYDTACAACATPTMP
jgi:hypothetical protein